jgi:hypothetical protein
MKFPKVHCNECGRRIKDHAESKVAHILKYHPHVPLIRIATTMFSPVMLESIGHRIGEHFKRLVS